MFGKELAYGATTLKGRTFYFLFGLDHMGQRVRAFHVIKLLKGENINPLNILDAGCGDGTIVFSLSHYFNKAKVLGVDIDGDQIKNCILILSKIRSNNICFKKACLLSIKEQEKYDLILCIDVLEHIQNDQQVLNNLFTCLRRDGVAMIHVPQNHRLNKYYLGGLNLQERQADHVRDEYTEDEMIQKIESAGFRILGRRYTFWIFGSISRELYYKLEQLNSKVRFLFKVILFPLLIGFAFLDTKTTNLNHQGFLFKVAK